MVLQTIRTAFLNVEIRDKAFPIIFLSRKIWGFQPADEEAQRGTWSIPALRTQMPQLWCPFYELNTSLISLFQEWSPLAMRNCCSETHAPSAQQLQPDPQVIFLCCFWWRQPSGLHWTLRIYVKKRFTLKETEKTKYRIKESSAILRVPDAQKQAPHPCLCATTIKQPLSKCQHKIGSCLCSKPAEKRR